MSGGRWIQRIHSGGERREARVRLFCLHHAGGGAMVFRNWHKALPEWVDACAVVMPGREARHAEEAYSEAELAVEALHEALLPWMDRPFVLFGHSMGALLSFELARRLARFG